MQQQNHKDVLEELHTLESFVCGGCNLPYGPSVLFQRLAARYPRHFLQFMDRYVHNTPREGAETLHHQVPLARAAVEALAQKLEHYLTHPPRSGEEEEEFRRAVEGLENGLWRRHFHDGRYTHFLDIDQYTDDEEGLGIQSLFYYIDCSTLRILLTGRDGEKPVAGTMPIHSASWSPKEHLAAFLRTYFSEPGSHSGNNRYLWSNIISREEFEAFSNAGLAVKRDRKAAAERLGKDNELIRYCAQHHLSPRPEGSKETAWLARCPSGGNHTILISTASNQWGCGYCRKKGGLEELRQWIESRQKTR